MAVGPGMVWCRGPCTSKRGFTEFPADYTDRRADLAVYDEGEGVDIQNGAANVPVCHH